MGDFLHPEVTAIIPVHNRWDLTSLLLADLRAQTIPVKEIVVVDNGSTDGSAGNASRDGARILSMGSNTGFATAVNAGVLSASTEYLVVINNDVRLPPNWLAILLESITPGIWFANGKLYSGAHPDEIDGAFDLISRGGCAWRAGHGMRTNPGLESPRQIDFPSFTAGLFRRALFDRVGLLEEAFESYLEDIDFGLRCTESGLRGIYVPAATGIHEGSATFGPWNPETARHLARNQLWIVARHFSRVDWPVVLSQLLFVALGFRNGAGWAVLRGKWQGVMGFRRMRRLSPRIDTSFLDRHEREITALQGSPAADLFWRLYFKLT